MLKTQPINTLDRTHAIADDIVRWRRDFHAHPELSFQEFRTAAIVADALRAMGYDDVQEGIGRTESLPTSAAATVQPSASAPTWTPCPSQKTAAYRLRQPIPASCTRAATTPTPQSYSASLVCCARATAAEPWHGNAPALPTIRGEFRRR